MALGKRNVPLLICGIAGPAAYAVTVAVLGFLTPGYSHITMHMSGLGAAGAPYAFFMNLFGFFLPGAAGIAFSAGLYVYFGKGRASLLASLFLALSAAGMLGAGLFPCRPGCAESWGLHSMSAVFSGAGFIVSAALFSMVFYRKWGKGFSIYSAASAALTASLGLFFLSGVSGEVQGLVQRAVIFFPFLWLALVSVKSIRSR